MTSLPQNFDDFLTELLATVQHIEGFLTQREAKFLALLAACPTVKGVVLEIGSFKGRSTIVLARSSAMAGQDCVVAVDPLTSPSVTDPDLRGEESSLRDFQANLTSAEVQDCVEFHHKYSSELAAAWNRDIRLLWIDGDHTYAGTKADLRMFSPYLSDGAIVAMHDVLHLSPISDGPIRVFTEDILLSENFGPAGMCGSIGWAQYFRDAQTTSQFRNRKMALYRKLKRLIPCSTVNQKPRRATKIWYKILRSVVPHSDVDPARWLGKVVFRDTEGASRLT